MTPTQPTQERPGRIEYLYLTPAQQEAKATLDDAVDELDLFERLRCRTPELREKNGALIEYYPHADYDERMPPDPITAAQMCATRGVMCPVARECYDYALALEAPVGVWGGRTFVDGQPVVGKSFD